MPRSIGAFSLADLARPVSTSGSGWEEVDYDGIVITANNPSVTTQPANQLVAAGALANFSVTATTPGGFPVTGYQWYFATNLSTTTIFNTNYHPIPGANSSTYSIPNVSTTNQGQYFVIVSNSDSSIGSAAASLSITVPSILAQPATNQSVLQGGISMLQPRQAVRRH